ncbi:MAG: ABC-2 family transporter protein [Oscillospiraceae bacterium]|jgi:ABC-2 type transport system permease protein|nr:ABC-2 family transporter protein [Oscillospiraceae bacterium]
MSEYFAMFKMKLIAGMQYRAAAWAGLATNFVWGFATIMIFQAFYRSSSAAPPMEWSQLVAYNWLRQAFIYIWAMWGQDEELLAGIRDGHVAYELCRPYDMYSFWYARLCAMRVSGTALRFLPVITIALILPGAYRLTPPASVGALAMFLLSLTLALALVVAISMFIYILTFVTLTPQGASLIMYASSEFLGGMLIPIPLMPEWLQTITAFFPFRYLGDLPFRLYSGNISGVDAVFQIMIQLAWIVGLILLGRVAFRHVTRRVVVQGG